MFKPAGRERNIAAMIEASINYLCWVMICCISASGKPFASGFFVAAMPFNRE